MFPAVPTLTALYKRLSLALVSFLFQAQPILSLTVLSSQRYCKGSQAAALVFMCSEIKLTLIVNLAG